MANTSVSNNVIDYVRNYGKPEESERIYPLAVSLSLLIIVSLTALAFRFHAEYLCALLIGEYKEQYEYLRALFRQPR